MHTLPRLTAKLAVVASFGALLVTARDSAAQSGGAVLRFAILGGPAVTCTRSTTSGDVGVASTTAFTNTGCTITGNIHAGDASAAQACNVIWWSEAAATQTDSDLKGNILSGAAITLTRGSFVGRALAKAAVTLTDVRTLSGCV